MKFSPSALLILCAAVVFSACSSSKPPELATAEDRFREGMNEFVDENYFEAIQHFDVIRIQFPGSIVADSARFFCGMSRYNREEYLLASYEFNQLIQNIPSSRLVPEAQYMLAECYYQLSPAIQLDQVYTYRAINELQTFLELNPGHPRAQEAQKQTMELYDKLAEKEFVTGILYRDMESWASALIYFDNVIERYYNTSFVDDAMVEKLGILQRRKKWQEASRLADTFLEKYADSPLRQKVERIKVECDRARTTTSAGSK